MAMIYSFIPLDEIKYVQVAKNYYSERDEWSKKSEAEQHIELYQLVSSRRKDLMFTGHSACILHGIPRLEKSENRPHCISEKTKGSDFICWRHGARDPNATMIKGLFVASPTRAICDLAKYDSLSSLLVSINHCLCNGLFTKEQLSSELEAFPKKKWQSSIKRLLKVATGKCESPLETLAWKKIYNAGFILPEQQVNIYNKHFLVGRVDMYWELTKRKIILELDGKVKYQESKDIFAEKKREDNLREMGYEIVRATWKDVENDQLLKKLEKVKIPKRRYCRVF